MVAPHLTCKSITEPIKTHQTDFKHITEPIQPISNPLQMPLTKFKPIIDPVDQIHGTTPPTLP
jgi:hypothetical protein